MDQEQATPEKGHTTKFPVLYVAFELGNSTWKMACSDGRKVRQVTVRREIWGKSSVPF